MSKAKLVKAYLNDVAQPFDERVSKQEIAAALNYLDAFGYLSGFGSWRDITLGDIVDALMMFQGFFHLKKKDGILGPKTAKAMFSTPRCGHPDVVPEKMLSAEAVTKNGVPIWSKTDLTFRIIEYVPGLTKQESTNIIKQAFNQWSTHTPLTFTHVSSRDQTANFTIGTGEGPRSQFDGPGGTLAWAYLPDGQDSPLLSRFDVGETWIKNPRDRGILMLNVACHEFGHLLGLEHSQVKGALMAPYYNPAIALPQQKDDVTRIQRLYGKNSAGTPTPPAGPRVLPAARRPT